MVSNAAFLLAGSVTSSIRGVGSDPEPSDSAPIHQIILTLPGDILIFLFKLPRTVKRR